MDKMEKIKLNFVCFVHTVKPNYLLLFYVLVRPREFSMSWEYVDLSSKRESTTTSSATPSSMSTMISTIAPSDYYDDTVDSIVYPRKATGKSFVDVPPVSQISIADDDPINSALVYQLKDKDKIAFSDIMEQTERMLRYELLCNPPNKDGIGKHVFGMFSDSFEKVGIFFLLT